jgi:hypothetical protein
MKLRLHGTPTELHEATRRLVELLDVVAVSHPYPDRGISTLVRVYLEVRLTPADQPPPSPPPAASGRRSR